MKKLLVLLLCTTGLFAAPITNVTFKITNNLDKKTADDNSLEFAIKTVVPDRRFPKCRSPQYTLIPSGQTMQINADTGCEISSVEITLISLTTANQRKIIYTASPSDIDAIGSTPNKKSQGNHTQGVFEIVVKGTGTVEIQ